MCDLVSPKTCAILRVHPSQGHQHHISFPSFMLQTIQQCHDFGQSSVTPHSNPPLTPPVTTQQTSQRFRDNWSWLGHNLIYTKPSKSQTWRSDWRSGAKKKAFSIFWQGKAWLNRQRWQTWVTLNPLDRSSSCNLDLSINSEALKKKKINKMSYFSLNDGTLQQSRTVMV